MPAFGRTRLQIVNAALLRMREAEVATASSTVYALLVATTLNLIKAQMEQVWQWRDLRDTYTVSVTPGTTSYSLLSAGQFAQIIDVWNRTTNEEVVRGTTRDFNKKFFGVATVETGNVTHYNPVGTDANYDFQFDTWPDVESTNSLRVNAYVPEPDPPTDSTIVTVPNQVLVEGIVAYLLAERGDDGGITAQTQQAVYQEMLSNAIANEVGQDQSEVDWAPV